MGQRNGHAGRERGFYRREREEEKFPQNFENLKEILNNREILNEMETTVLSYTIRRSNAKTMGGGINETICAS